MRLAVLINSFSFITLVFSSCDKNVDMLPGQCNCDIETVQISAPSLVTYRVSAHADARVSSITYQTREGTVAVKPDSFPFTASAALDKGDRVVLKATGNPKGGSIVLGYEVQEQDTPDPQSSSSSRVWVLENGICQ